MSYRNRDKNSQDDQFQPASALGLPTKPRRANHGQTVALLSNHYQFKLGVGGANRSIHKYSVKFVPEIPDNSKVGGKLVGKARDQVSRFLETYLHFGNCIYSPQMNQDPIECTVEQDGQEYKIKLTWAKAIPSSDPEINQFFKIIFNTIMGMMKFERVGARGNFVNPARETSLDSLKIWPGFFTALQNLDSGPVIQLDITHKVIRKDTLLQTISRLFKSGMKDAEEITKELKGVSVATVYGTNKHQYRIESIDFEKKPSDTFNIAKEEKSISYVDYYQQKYQVKITDKDQPLVVTKDQKTGREIYLVPELCLMTGLTDDHRKNFTLMSNMSKILHKNAEERKQEMQTLMTEIQNQERIKELLEKWKITMGKEQLKVEGSRIDGGKIQMGRGGSFSAHVREMEFDKNIQAPMYKQLPLQKWAIFHGTSNKKEAMQFKHEIKTCSDVFKFNATEPVLFEVTRDRDVRSWEKMLTDKLSSSVTAIVLILQGQKNAAPMYDPLKKLLLEKIPVPSQVVLASTISRGKNLRSICNKILIQINAKIGGEPWAIDSMPFMDKACMIVGYDVFQKRGQASQLAYCATMTRTGTKYWSKSVKLAKDGVVTQLEEIVSNSLEAFKKQNGCIPSQVIIFRDGVGDKQIPTIQQNEIEQIKKGFRRHKKEMPFIFVMVNKRIKTKLVEQQRNASRLTNPQPGTVLDHTVTGLGVFDWYMVSQNTRQGVPTPCHYTVLHNSIPDSTPEMIQKLAYRLCYTYYNFSGPVKVPAPIKYADKLASLTGERQNIEPHKRFEQLQGLHFI